MTGLLANRPPLGTVRRRRGPSQEYNAIGVGRVAVQIELRDSSTDLLLAAAYDRYQGWNLDRNTVARQTWGDVNRAFDMWGRTVIKRSMEGKMQRSSGP